MVGSHRTLPSFMFLSRFCSLGGHGSRKSMPHSELVEQIMWFTYGRKLNINHLKQRKEWVVEVAVSFIQSGSKFIRKYHREMTIDYSCLSVSTHLKHMPIIQKSMVIHFISAGSGRRQVATSQHIQLTWSLVQEPNLKKYMLVKLGVTSPPSLRSIKHIF